MPPAKGFAEMKDSGILGCGSIPSHWETIPLKYVALLDGKVDVSNIAPEDMVSFAPMECVRNDKRIPRTALKSKDNGTYSSFCNGDIAIAKVTPCFENGNICMMESLENGYAFDVYYWPESYVDGVKVHINTTGTIKGDIAVTASSGTPAGEYKSSLTIDNVNFEGKFVQVVEDAKENVTINSGSFKEDVTKYVPEGKASVKVDGTYYVGDAETVAEKVESATTAVVVWKGLEEVTVSENVLVINMTGSSINVNGETLGDRSEMYAPAKPEEEPSKEETTTPSISCAGEKDKNCDGVITCDEEMGDGWTWNNAKGVCEYTGTTSNTYTVVNTAVK